MFVDCPQCNTKFLVEPEQLGETGRKVRCGSCMHIWHQAPLPPEAKQIVEEVKQEQKENLQKAVEDKAAGKESSLPTVIKISSPQKWLKIAAGLLLVANLLVFIALNKELIGQSDFHDLIGDYNTNNVVIGKAQVTSTTQGARENVFYVSLEVQNDSGEKLKLPAYGYAIVDANKKVLKKSDIFRSKNMLDVGENFTFRAIKVEDTTKKGKYLVLDIGNPSEISTRW